MLQRLLTDIEAGLIDVVVVYKVDRLTRSLTDFAKLVDRFDNRGVSFVSVTQQFNTTTSMGRLPVDVLLGQGVGSESDLAARNEVHHHHHDDDHHHHDHDHDEFESFVVQRGEITDPKAFAEQVADIIRAHDILRLKGFAAVEGKPMRLTLQAVGPRVDTYFDQPFGDAPRTTRLVVIGQAGLDRAAIETALSA